MAELETERGVSAAVEREGKGLDADTTALCLGDGNWHTDLQAGKYRKEWHTHQGVLVKNECTQARGGCQAARVLALQVPGIPCGCRF